MTSNSPLVSIGLPVFNGERHVGQAIESMLAQDVDHLELIISDNGSTDATEHICREFAGQDQRIRYVRSATNRGAAWNYNRVFELAQGEYFKWAAHDDVCHPSFLSVCIAGLVEHPGASLCYANTVRIDDGGQELRRERSQVVASDARAQDRVRALLLNPTPCFEVFGVMRRVQLADTGLIGAYAGSDTVLLVELALQGPFVMVDDYLFFNREHEARSIRRYRDARQRNAWFDPTLRDVPAAPRWRLVREYAAAVTRAGLLRQAPLHTLTTLTRWAAGNRRRLVGEVARLAWTTVARAINGNRGTLDEESRTAVGGAAQ